MWCLLGTTGSAAAQDPFGPVPNWPLPPAPRSSGFDRGWMFATTDAFLLRLVAAGDPFAPINTYWKDTAPYRSNPEKLARWREELRRIRHFMPGPRI